MGMARSAGQLMAGAARQSLRFAAAGTDAALSLREQLLWGPDRTAQAVREAAGTIRATADTLRGGASTLADWLDGCGAGGAVPRLLSPAAPGGSVPGGGAPGGQMPNPGRIAATAVAELADAGAGRSRRRVWSRAGRAHIEVRGLTRAAGSKIAAGVTAALREAEGVHWAEVNAVTQQILVSFDEDKVSIDTVLGIVEAVEEAHGAQDAAFDRAKPEIPGDPSAEYAVIAALTASLAGAGIAGAAKLLGITGLPRAVRLPVVFAQSHTRLRAEAEARLGALPAGLMFGLASAAVHAATADPFPLAVESAQNALAVLEARSVRLTWERRAAELSAHPPAEARAPRPARPAPLPPGPVEKAAERTSLGGLAAAGGVLAASRDADAAADLLLATTPKAVRLGREAFASSLAHELGRAGILLLDTAALRRLDRVSAVVIDSAALRADDGGSGQPGPGGHGGAPGGHQATKATKATKATRAIDPLADAVIRAARDCAQQVLLTDDPAVSDLLPWADDVVPSPASLAGRVRDLQAGGHGVLVVGCPGDDALADADVGIAITRGHRVSWTADILCGAGLADVWRLLRAVTAAREVSERSARLAMGGASLGALLEATGRDAALGITPVNGAAGIALLSGAASARTVARLQPPQPVLRERWHEMTAGQVREKLRRASGAGVTAVTAQQAEPAQARPAGPGSPATSRTVSRVPTGSAQARPAGPGSPAGPGGPGGVAALLARTVREELSDPLTPVLALGAAASAVIGSGVDAALVGGVMAGNALIGAAQRIGAERALRSLLLHERLPARLVMADGSVHRVSAAQLVPGDIIELRASDVVPADVRLLDSDRLEVDQATLTGESLPVPKSPEPTPGAELADRSCMLYEGTTVLTGSACAAVVATGEATEAGRAAAVAGRRHRETGVQASLAELTKIAIPATWAGGAAVTGLSLLRRIPFTESLASGIALAVAAVPEGLPIVATVSQLAAARRLSRSGVLVRSPRTLEALGRVDTFCFDKTGTLTEGRLRVTRLAGTQAADANLPAGDPFGRRVLRAASRACPQHDGVLAHATDRAIVEAARERLGPDREWTLWQELPFEASRGYSASLGADSSGAVLVMKGAPEVVADRCACDRGGRPLTPQRRGAVTRLVRGLAGDGLRVIAVAESRLHDTSLWDGQVRGAPSQARGARAEQPEPGNGRAADIGSLAAGMTLLGFVGISDAPRQGAAETVGRLVRAGVRVTMITGDHPVTASAVARQLGIPGSGTVLTGAELESLTERERLDRVPRAAVFARVSPEQKVRVIEALQQAGHVVAMTGDGVNDAAAIRLADVGIGIAGKGTAPARSAASLVLTDPDPARLVDMLAEGRSLWGRVRDAVSILVGGNAGEVAFTVLGTAAGGRAPLNTRQMLLVNMFTDMLPALAMALGPVGRPDGGDNDDELSAGPVTVSREEFGRTLLIRGGATAAGAGAAWYAGRPAGHRRAGTMGLGALVLTELGQTMLMGWRSPLVVGTCAVSAAALIGVVETPGVSQFFGCTPLGPAGWGIVAASSAAATAGSAVVPRLFPGHRTDGGGPSASVRQIPADEQSWTSPAGTGDGPPGRSAITRAADQGGYG